MSEYRDITQKCVEQTCETPNREFIVTAGEQEFFASKGFPIPKRCKQCRQNKKNRENSPFKPIADQMRRAGGPENGTRGDERPVREHEGKPYKKKQENKRRHGRERIADFEGEENYEIDEKGNKVWRF